MWSSYFFQVQNKYSMRVSLKKPLVIRFDGKNVTKDITIDLLSENKESFPNALEKTAKYFTYKYECISILGTDEISFVFTNPIKVIEDLDKEKYAKTNEIIALFSQYFFEYFNDIYSRDKKVFWHGKCFSINEDKINSYIKYRSGIIKNVITTYFLKRMNVVDAGRIKTNEKLAKCKEYEGYNQVKKIEDGILYRNGERIDIQEFLNGNIKVIEPEEKRTADEYFDITKWDI